MSNSTNVQPDIHQTLRVARDRGIEVNIRHRIGTVSRGWVVNLTNTRYELRDDTGSIFGPIEFIDDAWFSGPRHG